MVSCADSDVNWFKNKGQWFDGLKDPQVGVIIFFDCEYDVLNGSGNHVGIVEKIENGYVYTIEGNLDDACKEHMYSIECYGILEYGVVITD